MLIDIAPQTVSLSEAVVFESASPRDPRRHRAVAAIRLDSRTDRPASCIASVSWSARSADPERTTRRSRTSRATPRRLATGGQPHRRNLQRVRPLELRPDHQRDRPVEHLSRNRAGQRRTSRMPSNDANRYSGACSSLRRIRSVPVVCCGRIGRQLPCRPLTGLEDHRVGPCPQSSARPLRAFIHRLAPPQPHHHCHPLGRRPPWFRQSTGGRATARRWDLGISLAVYVGTTQTVSMGLDNTKRPAIVPCVGLPPFVPRTQYRRLPYDLGLPNNIKRLWFLGWPNRIAERRYVRNSDRCIANSR